MSHRNYIQFLGTAGGRYVVARQIRSSAGTYLSLAGERLILDPGPGTLLRCTQVDPPVDVTALTGVIVSHGHVDHSTDANAVIDAMTAGGWEPRGALFAPREALHGKDRVILRYLRPFLNRIDAIEPHKEYRLGALRFRASARHRHGVEAYGVVFDVDGLRVGFMVDTRYAPDIAESYQGCDLLVMNVVLGTRDASGRILHLSLPDVYDVVRVAEPRRVILTHLGMSVLRDDPAEQAHRLSDDLGIEVMAAEDGMVVELESACPDGPSAEVSADVPDRPD